ncbi:MAG: hypothetical protein QY307_00420 [Acidimicrobiia bacterium]|nr:MAG: hypothetical protein QY307_00420 [Acidimicrobiia bacterium]
MPTAARPAGAAAGEQVEGDGVPDLGRSGEIGDLVAGGDDDSGRLVARSHRVPPLLAGEQPALEGADAAGAHVDQ